MEEADRTNREELFQVTPTQCFDFTLSVGYLYTKDRKISKLLSVISWLIFKTILIIII